MYNVAEIYGREQQRGLKRDEEKKILISISIYIQKIITGKKLRQKKLLSITYNMKK